MILKKLSTQNQWGAREEGNVWVVIFKKSGGEYVGIKDGEIMSKASSPEVVAEEMGYELESDGHKISRIWERADKRILTRDLAAFLLLLASLLFSLSILTSIPGATL